MATLCVLCGTHMTTTAPAALAACSPQSVGTPTVGGFTMCSGTSGDGFAGPLVPNTPPTRVQQYLAHYNSDVRNACISQFVPASASTTDSSANTVPFTTAQGCCSTVQDWAAAPGAQRAANSNASRKTRLKAFTTASAVGALDDAGLRNGLPAGLTALDKSWGFSKNKPVTTATHWAHGGVRPGNVGVWYSQAGFPCKWKGTAWSQQYVMWSRLTGDDYQAALDPYGALAPAPAGVGPTPASSAATPLPGPCKGCDVASSTGQVFLPAPGSGQAAAPPPPCGNPYAQSCAAGPPLTAAVMSAAGWDQTTLPPGYGPPNTNNGYTNPLGRVGGVFATQDMYGPGTFSVLANLPPTAPAPPPGGGISPIAYPQFPMVDPASGEYPSAAPGAVRGGRGYVFSIWTFAYTEAYQSTGRGTGDAPMKDPYSTGISSTCAAGKGAAACGQSSYGQTVETAGGSGGGPPLTNTPVTFPSLPGLVSGDPADGVFAAHNHEIDIEIPANSAAFQGPGMNQALGLDTANFNTWLSDTDQYSPGALAMYQQAQARAPPGQFFCAVGPEDDENTYHEYSFVWYVDPAYNAAQPGAAADGSYVAFLLDGTEIFRTKRYVPRRSGRVLIGLWPGWWGSNYYPLTFNQVYAKFARMEFVPQRGYDGSSLPALVTNAAQVYDQEMPVPAGSSISCGIGTVVRTPVSVNGTWKRPGLSAVEIALITLGVAAVVVGIVLGAVYGSRAVRRHRSASAQ